MSDEVLPFINIDLGGEPFEATPLNATLFTFAGHTVMESGEVIDNASRNHIFLERGKVDPEGEVVTGAYIFEPAVVEKMGSVMIRHGYPCRLNHRDIQPCDESAYQTYIDQQLAYESGRDERPDWL